MNPDVTARVQTALDSRLTLIRMSEAPGRPSQAAVEQKWNEFLEGMGARRVGKLMGLIVGPEAGMVRFKDSLGQDENRGFVEMDMETADKIATLGTP